MRRMGAAENDAKHYLFLFSRLFLIMHCMDFSSESVTAKRFSKRAFGGVDELEVRDYLISLSDEMRRLQDLLKAGEKRIQELEGVIEESRAREHILKESITAVQKVTQKMREDAEAQSGMILQAAQDKKSLMIRDAEASLQSIYNDIASLKRFYIQFKSNLKASIQAHLEMIEKESPALAPLLESMAHGPASKEEADPGKKLQNPLQNDMSGALSIEDLKAPMPASLPPQNLKTAPPPSPAAADLEKAPESLSKSLKSLSEDFL